MSFCQSKKEFEKIENTSKWFHQSLSAEIIEASFEITHMITKEKKPHSIGEALIKPCLLKAAGLVLRKTYSKKIAMISFLDSTIKSLIGELEKDIGCKVLKNALQ